MSKTRVFSAPDVDLAKLVGALRNWFEVRNFQTQVLTMEEGPTVVQAQKRGKWRNLIGQSTALNVILQRQGAELRVITGHGKWLDKAAVATVSMFVLWPLMVTTIIGTIAQIRLSGRVLRFIAGHLDRYSGSVFSFTDDHTR